ncbi:MAG: trypsin-like peptidase domain-containing protein [Elusimicrobia bacterium]|nr:trypsin-like peptidase domain-containing protein [Elusimicrobiota bacterium]
MMRHARFTLAAPHLPLLPPLLMLLTLLPAAASAKSADREDGINRSVVRIFVSTQKPDFYQPWQMGAPDNVTGSGCVIAGDRILTNAHVVSDQIFIQVRKAGDPRRYNAKVEFVAHDAELAVLKVEDPSFFKDTRSLELGDLPRQRDSATVYGFPEGGEELSITEGIISRIEVTAYSHSGRFLLTLQTDAAINPGNSGGPVVRNGRLIGVSFQAFTGGENIGYAVPAPLIRRFLKDIEDGSYDGVPLLGLNYQPMLSESLRAYYGLKPEGTGVLVTGVYHGSSASAALKPGDVITAVDGVPVGDDGTVEIRKGLRLILHHIFSLRQLGDTVVLSILRDGKPSAASVTLRRYRDLVDDTLYDQKPTYYIFAGLVFTPLTPNYIGQWESDDIPTDFKVYREFGRASESRRQAVALAYVLPHEINAGYHDWRGQVIESINGVRLKDIKDVITAFQHPQGPWHVIRTDNSLAFSTQIVLDAAKAAVAHQEILARHGIPADRSADLR